MLPAQDPWTDAMRRGDFAAAWAISDAVLAGRDRTLRDDPRLPYHQRFVWDGTPPDGADVLVRCYHGLGDTIQFARFLPALAARAARVTVEAQAELLPLLRGMRAPVALQPFDQAAPAKPRQCDIEIMELAHALRLRPEAAPPPYLRAPPQPAPPGAIGLCWRAGGWDAARSIDPALLAPLLALGRPAYALCPGPAPPGFRNPDGAPAAVQATASLMAGLAAIITVDTMVAHLAGALGLPTWLLLKRDADWRWSEAAPWYPSVRLLRQQRAGDWAGVAARAARDVMKLK